MEEQHEQGKIHRCQSVEEQVDRMLSQPIKRVMVELIGLSE